MIGLPSDGWKFGPAMRENPSADNTLAVGFPRSLLPRSLLLTYFLSLLPPNFPINYNFICIPTVTFGVDLCSLFRCTDSLEL